MAAKNQPAFQGTIIIIDDSTTNCELCRIFLEMEGFQVHITGNDQQGLNAIRRTTPDLILLDLMMPGMDGFEVLEQLKADPVSRDIPVLVHSVRSETPAVVKALNMGAGDFLKKPFDIDELIARVKNLMVFKKDRDAIITAAIELVRRQHHIDAALEQWEREADAFRRLVETSDINILAGTKAAFTLEQARASSAQARRLISQIADLSRQRLPEYDELN